MADAETTGPPRAGWYPDPHHRYPRRWWDGSAWTAYVVDTDVRWDDVPLGPPPVPRPGVRGLGIAVVGAATGFAVGLGAHLLLARAGEPGGPAATHALSALGLWSGLIGACAYASRRRGTGSISRDFQLRFRWLDLGLGLAGALVGRIMAVVAVSPIPLPTRRLGEAEEEVFEGLTHGFPEVVVMIVATCIGAPLVEELFFRGLLQGRLVGRFGAPVGIAVASVLFGAAHLSAWQGSETIVYAWAVTSSGVVLGVMRHFSGRLGAPILAHAFFNTQAVVVILAFS